MEILFERHGCIVYRFSAELRFVNVKLERIMSIATIVLVNVFLGVVISNELGCRSCWNSVYQRRLTKEFFFGQSLFESVCIGPRQKYAVAKCAFFILVQGNNNTQSTIVYGAKESVPPKRCWDSNPTIKLRLLARMVSFKSGNSKGLDSEVSFGLFTLVSV